VLAIADWCGPWTWPGTVGNTRGLITAAPCAKKPPLGLEQRSQRAASRTGLLPCSRMRRSHPLQSASRRVCAACVAVYFRDLPIELSPSHSAVILVRQICESSSSSPTGEARGAGAWNPNLMKATSRTFQRAAQGRQEITLSLHHLDEALTAASFIHPAAACWRSPWTAFLRPLRGECGPCCAPCFWSNGCSRCRKGPAPLPRAHPA